MLLGEVVSSIFDNALDSLKVGMTLYMSGNLYSTRKHAILAVFHSIELMLKEYLYQANPILIYKNIDEKITDDSLTVGLAEILIRLDNLGLSIPGEQARVILSLQSKRNRIDHHRDDCQDEEREIITEALKFVLYFMMFQLKKQPEETLESELMRQILGLTENNSGPDVLADFRLESWLNEKWPNWDQETEAIPKEFTGVDACPQCENEYLIMEQIDEPYCFWCCSEIPAEYCDTCGLTKKIGVFCC